MTSLQTAKRGLDEYPHVRQAVYALATLFPGQVESHASADQWTAPCPRHPDSDRWALWIAPDELGRVVIECGEGCSALSIARLIHLAPEFLTGTLTDTAATPSRFKLLSDIELEQLPPVQFLVDGVLPRAGLGTLYGMPGSGKSFLALDMACSIATGSAWLGHPTHRGSVVYVAAEGSAGLAQRLRAWKEHRGLVGTSVAVHFLTEPANLLGLADVASLIQALEQLEDAPSLIIVDTLARSMPGGDENSAQDMGLVVKHADELRRKSAASVLLVHHTALNTERERGSSSLRGAMDAMLFAKSEDGIRVLKCEKAKDWAPFADASFRLLPVLDSCVIATNSVLGSGDSFAFEAITPTMRKALTVLARDFPSKGATSSEWLAATELPQATYYRVRSLLVTNGYVTEPPQSRGGKYKITDSGASVVAINPHDTITNLSAPLAPLLSSLSPPLKGDSIESMPESQGSLL
ncbi:MAG: Primase 2 [Gemmatimonadetes bacterium]|nr:Primase 2 [Gemmatimonadota bacterium]